MDPEQVRMQVLQELSSLLDQMMWETQNEPEGEGDATEEKSEPSDADASVDQALTQLSEQKISEGDKNVPQRPWNQPPKKHVWEQD